MATDIQCSWGLVKLPVYVETPQRIVDLKANISFCHIYGWMSSARFYPMMRYLRALYRENNIFLAHAIMGYANIKVLSLMLPMGFRVCWHSMNSIQLKRHCLFCWHFRESKFWECNMLVEIDWFLCKKWKKLDVSPLNASSIMKD